MVTRVINAMYKEVRGLHQAAYVLALFTIGSQLLALIRDRLLANQFGAGIELDLYYTAFRIPDFLYVLFASTLSVYVLIPFVAERITGNDTRPARELLSQVFSLFLFVYSALAGIVILFAPFFVPIVFPGFENESSTLVALMRILMLQPLLLGLSSLLGVITQFGHRFALYAVSPLLYNVGIIIGVLFLYPYMGMIGLAWGVVIGAAGHLMVQLPFIKSHELAPRLLIRFDWKAIGEVLRISIPRALTLSLHQFVLLGLIGFASIMTIGSVSVFQFAFNLQSVPLAIIGVSYSVAAFPLLAQLYAEKKFEEFGRSLMNVLRHIIFWSLPVIALIVVIRAQFVRVILGSGAFDWGDTRLTAAILALFALSLAAQSMHLVLVRALYAAQNTRLPFYATLFSSILALSGAFGFHVLITETVWFRVLLESLMRLNDVEGIEVLALPLGYSCALILQVVFLILMSKVELFINGRLLFYTLSRGIAASIIAGFCAYTTLNFFATGIEADTLFTISLQGLMATTAGCVGGMATYYVCRSPELKEAYQAVHKKIFKTAVVGPQDEDQLSL